MQYVWISNKMGKRLHKIDSCEATHCYSYSVGTKDDDHLFQCQARYTFLRSIQRKLKDYRDKLDPNLYELLIDGISTTFVVPSYPL